MRVFSGFLLFCLALAAPAAAENVAGRPRVVDGDSLTFSTARVRLADLDAPEIRQVCVRRGKPWRAGLAAAAFVREFIDGREVVCRAREHEKYGRLVAVCEVDGENLNAAIVRAGWAVAYRKYSSNRVPEEIEARVQKRGIWAEGAHCASPDEWRKASRERIP